MNEFVGSLVASALPELLKMVFEALGVVLATYGVVALHRFAKKIGLEVTERQDAQVKFIVKEAVQKAEEVVNARMPKNDPSRPQAKLSEAINAVMDALPKMTAGEAQSKIHATLPELGLGASAPKLVPFEPAAETK